MAGRAEESSNSSMPYTPARHSRSHQDVHSNTVPIGRSISETSARKTRDAVERSPTRRKRSRSRSGRKRTAAGPTELREKHAEYGFDIKQFANKVEAMNAFLMRLIGKSPREPALWSMLKATLSCNGNGKYAVVFMHMWKGAGFAVIQNLKAVSGRKFELLQDRNQSSDIDWCKGSGLSIGDKERQVAFTFVREPVERFFGGYAFPMEFVGTTENLGDDWHRFMKSKHCKAADIPCNSGEPALWSMHPSRVEGQLQSTLRLDSRCCAKIWPQEDPNNKFFVGEIRRKRSEANESPAEKFWADPDVRKAAAILPPSQKEKDRIANRNIYLPRQREQQKATNTAKRSLRLTEKARPIS